LKFIAWEIIRRVIQKNPNTLMKIPETATERALEWGLVIREANSYTTVRRFSDGRMWTVMNQLIKEENEVKNWEELRRFEEDHPMWWEEIRKRIEHEKRTRKFESL
jgi:hypothetical protein